MHDNENPPGSNRALVLTFQFKDHPVTWLEWRGIQVWIAREIGRAQGYADDGARLVKNITQRWSVSKDGATPRFRLGHESKVGQEHMDGFCLKGDALRALRSFLKGGQSGPPSQIDPRINSILLLTESGLYNVMGAAQTPQANEFRHWVNSEVLPSIRKTGSYQAPQVPAAPDPALLRAQAALARERRLEKKLELEQQRFEREEREAQARAMEICRDDLKALGRLPEAQEAALTLAANEYRTGRTHTKLLPVDEAPDWKVQSEVAAELQVSSRAVGDIARSLGVILPNKKGAEGKCEAVVTKAANVDRMVTVYRFSPGAIEEIRAALPAYIRAKPGRLKKYGHLLSSNAA